jgi:hypothetical protein
MPKIVILLTKGYAAGDSAFLNGIGSAYSAVETSKLINATR